MTSSISSFAIGNLELFFVALDSSVVQVYLLFPSLYFTKLDKINDNLLIPVILACSGWQIKQTVHSLQAPQSVLLTPPKTLRLHWSREASNPWQFIWANQVFFAPWVECGHFLLRKLSFKGGPCCSCRHITSADRYDKSWYTAQITPHVPLYLTCKWPTLGVFIPNKRTSKPMKDGWMTVLWIIVRYCVQCEWNPSASLTRWKHRQVVKGSLN